MNFNNSLTLERISVFYEDNKGAMWIGTQNGLYRYENGEYNFYDQKNGLVNNIIWDIKQDNDNNIWFATDSGVSRFNGKGFENFTKKNGFVDYSVWSIFIDRESNLWFGTDDGLYLLNNETFKRYKEFNGADIDAWAVTEDRSGKIWIASDLQGIILYSNGRFKTFETKDKLKIKGASTILEDKKGTIWFGSDNGVYFFKNGKLKKLKLTSKKIFDPTLYILEDDKSNLWFGNSYEGLYKYDGKNITNYTTENGLNSSAVYSLFQDKNKNLWVGSNLGISKFENGKFIVPEECEWLKKYTIMNILEDKSGNLWLGTYEGGVIKYDYQNKAFDIVSVSEGLNNNSVLFTIADNSGNMWIGTNSGLNEFMLDEYLKTGEKHINAFNKYDGFPGTECVQNSAALDRKGNIWFGTVDGLIKFNPAMAKRKNIEPKIHITNLQIELANFEVLNLTEKFLSQFTNKNYLDLEYNKNNIRINFIGINLFNPKMVRYSYRITGKGWSKPSVKTSANFTNLPPGKYTFEVNASNNFNKWNNIPARVNFYIVAPFWKNIWFYLGLGLITVFLVYLLYKARLSKIKKANMDLKARIKERLEYEKILKKSELELIKAKEATERSNQLKSEFLAQMSHEIRTPLNSILSFSSLISDELQDTISSDLREGLQIIKNGGQRLIKTIDSILNMSRIQSGNIDLDVSLVDIEGILNELQTEFRSAAKAKNLELTFLNESENSKIQVDKYTVTQLFANLIDNAIKYTQQGEISIIIFNDEQKRVNVSVKDTGIGISEEFIDDLFTPFSQEESGYTRRFEGAGLGLALVKNYCELNKAEIVTTSQKGVGTEFKIVFNNNKI